MSVTRFKTFKSGREYFRLGAESYSSLRRVVKKEENSVVALRSLLNVFACGQVSSPRLYRLIHDQNNVYIFCLSIGDLILKDKDLNEKNKILQRPTSLNMGGQTSPILIKGLKLSTSHMSKLVHEYDFLF